jgi:hypothetical protein
MTAETFWTTRVEIKTPAECWMFLGSRAGAGYGYVGRDREYAHRFAYRAAYGEIPEGKQVLHWCDMPGCCNPFHLHAGTRSDNMQEAVARGRLHPWKTHITECKLGHPYSGPNLRVDKKGHRHCRACDKIYHQRWLAKLDRLTI